MADEWIIHGMEWDEPLRIRTPEELINWTCEIGFLPLFGNEIPGFSAENHTWSAGWWGEDPQQDPWVWREILARSGRVAYGKFFRGRAGFISKEWFPVFANARRDGYDFDARFEDELASYRSKKIMDLFEEQEELFSFEVRNKAGFGKEGGLKNFEGAITELQMQTYLVVRDFRRRINKKGREYGWSIAVYSTPEHIWGRDHVASCYKEDPEVSLERIRQRVRENFPWAEEHAIKTLIG